MHSNFRTRFCFIFYVIVFECLFIMPGFGQKVYEDSLMNGNNYEKAAFSLWFKQDVQKIRGIIVLVPGSNEDGRDMVRDTAWQHLAVKHNFALLGCYYQDKVHDFMDIEHYADVKNGSGQALLDILGNFSKSSQHTELAEAPLVLWGMSAGGEFNYEFLCWKPERVAAFVVNKGGVYYTALAPVAAWDVPGIFFVGEKDLPSRNQVIKGIFSLNRRFGAQWIFAGEPGVGHEFRKSGVFSRFFFDRVIPMRVPVDGVSGATSLSKLSSGYTGDPATREIQSDSVKARNEMSSWFPDREVADEWLNFISDTLK
jgi:dienelactone hydrolase